MLGENQKRLIGKFLKGSGGASAATFAMLLPILLLLVFATIEGGRLFHDYLVVDNSVRHATRYLSRQPVNANCNGFSDPAIETSAKTLALTGSPTGSQNLLSYWSSPASITITVSPYDNTSGTVYGGVYQSSNCVGSLTVVAQVPIDLFYRSSVLSGDTVNMFVSHNEVIVGD